MTLYHTDIDSVFVSQIQLIEEPELVIGGVDGVDNRALKLLANRTSYSKRFKCNLLRGAGVPDANTADDLTLDANSVNNVYYLDESTGSIHKLTAISPQTWTNITKDTTSNLRGVEINDAGDISKYFRMEYDTTNNRLQFINEFGDYADVRIGNVIYDRVDGITGTQSHIGDVETLLVFDIEQESQNQDGYYGVKRLSDVSGNVTNLETETDIAGSPSGTLDRWTVDTDMTTSLSDGDYIQIRGFSEDSGEEINGFYHINTINASYITTRRLFNPADGTIDSGDTGLISRDVSVFLQWDDSNDRFDLRDRDGNLLPINVSSLLIAGVGASPLADRTISTQAEWENYFGTNDGTPHYITSSERNVYIKARNDGGGTEYLHDHKVVFADSDIFQVTMLAGAKVQFTGADASFHIRNSSNLKVDSYTANQFKVNSEDTHNEDIDNANYGDQLDVNVGDTLFGFSKTENINKKYTVSSIVKSIDDTIEISQAIEQSSTNINTSDFATVEYLDGNVRKIYIAYIRSTVIYIQGFYLHNTDKVLYPLFAERQVDTSGAYQDIRMVLNENKVAISVYNTGGNALAVFYDDISDDPWSTTQGSDQVENSTNCDTQQMFIDDVNRIHIVAINPSNELVYFTAPLISTYNFTNHIITGVDASATIKLGFLVDNNEIYITYCDDSGLDPYLYSAYSDDGINWSISGNIGVGNAGQESVLRKIGTDIFVAYIAGDYKQQIKVAKLIGADSSGGASLTDVDIAINKSTYGSNERAEFKDIDFKLNTNNEWESNDLLQVSGLFNIKNEYIYDVGGSGVTCEDMVIDSDGTLHVSFVDITTLDIRYAKKPIGGSWTTELVSSDASYIKTSIAIKADGNPAIAYALAGNIKYVEKIGSTWQAIETVQSFGSANNPKLIFDGNTPVIAFIHGGITDLQISTKNNGAWTTETVHADSTGEIGICFDDNGRLAISHYDSSLTALAVSRKIGATWTTETVDNTGAHGTMSDIVCKANGDLVVSYRLVTVGVKIAWWTKSTASWALSTLETASTVTTKTSITLDKDDNPIVGYENSITGKLLIGWYNGTSWIVTATDSDVSNPSITCDSNNSVRCIGYTIISLQYIVSECYINNLLEVASSLNTVTKSWNTNSIEVHSTEAQLGLLTNDYLIMPDYNAFLQINTLNQIHYNLEIGVTETVETLGATDVVLSSDFIEEFNITMNINANNTGSASGSELSIFDIANLINSKLLLTYENSTHINGVSGEDNDTKQKTFGDTIKLIVKESTIANIFNKIMHCFVNESRLSGSTSKNFNDCQNLNVQAIVDGDMENGTGDFDE